LHLPELFYRPPLIKKEPILMHGAKMLVEKAIAPLPPYWKYFIPLK
jgi:hypothetical protein